MQFNRIKFERDNKVAKITLNRPEIHNPIDYQTVLEMEEALSRVEHDPTVRVLIITGEGNVLSVGADLKYLKSILNKPKEVKRYIWQLNRVLNHIEKLDIPTIAVVKGYALAGGLELMLACDFCIATKSARIGDQHANFGLIPGAGGTQRLPRMIGMQKAKELFFTGRWLTGKEAEAWGLVNTAVPDDMLEKKVSEITASIVNKSRKGLELLKFLVNRPQESSLSKALELERDVFLNYLNSPEVQEGLKAFEEKRAPIFD